MCHCRNHYLVKSQNLTQWELQQQDSVVVRLYNQTVMLIQHKLTAEEELRKELSIAAFGGAQRPHS